MWYYYRRSCNVCYKRTFTYSNYLVRCCSFCMWIIYHIFMICWVCRMDKIYQETWYHQYFIYYWGTIWLENMTDVYNQYRLSRVFPHPFIPNIKNVKTLPRWYLQQSQMNMPVNISNRPPIGYKFCRCEMSDLVYTIVNGFGIFCICTWQGLCYQNIQVCCILIIFILKKNTGV